ncbi:MAG: glycyl-radical enzyme activating protein [Planctomycetes bacterium]|nr:glycyl-radical enzyme activating protein [Planctomycetota bacterium]
MRIFKSGWSEGFDGPGRRWIVYLKGCNLRCRWCANPEGINLADEILFYPDRARDPDRACQYGAAAPAERGWKLDRGRCAQCQDRPCVSVWRHPAYEWAGEGLSPAQLEAQAMRYRPLFGTDGGVTFGGGEPTLQADDVLDAIRRLSQAGIHTALETNASTESFGRFVGEVDLLICDLKSATSALHEEWTGSGNRRVLDNLRTAIERQPALWIRIALIPGFNDADDEMAAIAAALDELGAAREDLKVEILRMHHLGEPKHAALGRKYKMAGVAEPSKQTAEKLAELIRTRNIDISLAA